MASKHPLFESLESRRLLSAADAATGSLRGGVFLDQNLNGVNDKGDVALYEEVSIYLDANNNGKYDLGERRTYPQSGHYHINNIVPGTYHLREVFGLGFTAPVADGYTIHVRAGKTLVRWLPVNPGASVIGTFFIDTNGDGIQESGEFPLDTASEQKLPGLYIADSITGLPPAYQHRPAGSGVYHIMDILPGTYHLHVIRAAYHYSTPIDVVLTFKAGQTITHNFGLRLPLP